MGLLVEDVGASWPESLNQ